tara:strand:- start:1259 stop:2206 length:948 start_codon:yes stop_codon:yes gene_type:complete
MNLQLRDIPILKDNELLKNNNSIELPCEISKDDLIFITPENINKVIEVLEYFSIKSYKIQSYIISNSVTTFEKFILNEKYINEYELPKFLKESIKDIDDLEDFLVCIDYCAEFGMFKWLKFLLENGNTFDEDFEDLSYSWACYNAAEKGSLECLKLLREYKFPWDDKVTNIAGVNKNIDCFIYAYENYCPFNEYIMSDLIQYGSLDCLKFLHQKEDFLSDSLCITAAHYGQYECLKYCYENRDEFIIWNENVINSAAYSGCIDCLKFAHENGCKLTEEVFRNVSISTNYDKEECIKYLKKNKCPKPKNNYYTDQY